MVSFCVIAYNEEKNLESLFSDIRNQDYPHEKMEIIFVNAMSTDRTRELMENFAKENNGFSRVKILDNPKKNTGGWLESGYPGSKRGHYIACRCAYNDSPSVCYQ